MPSVKVDFTLDFDPKLPAAVEKIAIEQGECEETKSETIAKFRSYILERNEFQPHRTDSEYLEKFLRARYWRIETSYKLMCNYYKFREHNKSLYEKVRPLDLKIVGESNIVTATPYRDQDGHRILIYRFGVWEPSKLNIDDIFRATIVILEMGAMEPIGQVMGGVGIFDLSDLSFSHVLNLSPSVAQKMIALLVTSMPIRTAAIHVVNQNWVFNAAYNIFKPFLDETMRKKLFIHGSDMSSLHQHISPEHLPKRYGGMHQDYPYSLWLDNLSGNTKLQKDLEQLGYVF